MTCCKPLYKKYPGQHIEQDAYLEMNEKGELSFDYNRESGSVPRSVFNGVRIWWSVSSDISESEMNRLKELVYPLATRLHKISPIEWNGSDFRRFISDKCIFCNQY